MAEMSLYAYFFDSENLLYGFLASFRTFTKRTS